MSPAMETPSDAKGRQPKGRALWRRLHRLLLPNRGGDDACSRRDELAIMSAPSLVPATAAVTPDCVRAAQLPGDGGSETSATILPFPIHGEALLVGLAERLRNRIIDRGPESDPLLLLMSRGPRSRLVIDRAAHVEFHRECCEYRAVIEASPGTRVILETVDFDALVDFVLQYVVARLAQPAALKAAS